MQFLKIGLEYCRTQQTFVVNIVTGMLFVFKISATQQK